MAAARARPTLGTSTRDAPVREMFDTIAPAYDALNRVITLNLDLLWDARVAKLVPEGGRVLDFGCGTGDFLERALLSKRPGALVGIDLSSAMVRAARRRLGSAPQLAQADGERLPFRDAAFDVVVSSFVMRNVGDRAQVYAEIARVLQHGGTFVQLELGHPKNAAIHKVFAFYFERLMPALAGAVFGERAPYEYLAQSLSRWPGPEEIAEEVRAAGFASVEALPLTLGVVCAHRAVR